LFFRGDLFWSGFECHLLDFDAAERIDRLRFVVDRRRESAVDDAEDSTSSS
jgi:hypothetical protein